MSKLSFALSILVLHFTFHSIQAQPGETKTGTATISGRVTLKGEPARGVTVILRGEKPSPSNLLGARTDESGQFRFTGVTADKYSIYAHAPGYISPDDKSFFVRGKTLYINEGEKVDNVDLGIKRGGVITGRITDSQGRPMIEETITLSRRDKNNQPQFYFASNPHLDMDRTDDRGVYRIYGLPEGRYLVSVGHAQEPSSGRVISSRTFHPRVFYPNATSESKAKVIEVSEGSEATDVDITISDPIETRDVSGRVVDASTGRPVADVMVVVSWISNDGKPTGISGGDRSRSGSDGEFRMLGVAPGKYELFVHPRESNGYVSDKVIFDISEGDATGIELKVRKGDASISGVVVIEGTDDPMILSKLSKVNVAASIAPTDRGRPGPIGSDPVRVNADGSFRLSRLDAGKAEIMIDQSPERGLTIARIEYNGALVRDGIEIGAGEQLTGVRIVLLYGTLTLRGEMKVVGGTLPDVYRFFARARRTDQNAQYSQGTIFSEPGKFVIENLAPGEYEVGVDPMDLGKWSPEIRERVTSARKKVVVSSDNQRPVTLVIDLSRKEGDK